MTRIGYDNTPQTTGRINYGDTSPVVQNPVNQVPSVRVSDVIKGMPKAAVGLGSRAVNFLFPGITQSGLQSGRIIGEGIAYATNPKVREEYAKGRLEVMPTVSTTKQKDILKDTLNAGVEASLYRALPPILKSTPAIKRAGQGALEGIGFMITDGVAKDKSVKEIVKDLPLAAVFGAGAAYAVPWLTKALSKEIPLLTRKQKKVFEKAFEESTPPKYIEDGDIEQIIGKKSRLGDNPEKQLSTYNKFMRKKVEALPSPKDNEEVIFYQPTGDGIQYVNTKLDRQFYTNVDDNFVAEVVPKNRLTSTGDELKDAVGERLLLQETKQGKVDVSSDQLPVGSGVQKASALSKRLSAIEDDVVSYNVSDHEKSMAKVEKHYQDNDKLIDDLIAGKTDLDVEVNALLPIALSRTSQMTTKQLQKLATAKNVRSLASTRMGQELSILQQIDPDNPINVMSDIITARTKRVERGGIKVSQQKETIKKEIRKEMTKEQIKIEEAEKLLDNIPLC